MSRNQPFRVGDYGSCAFQLTVTDQDGSLITADNTVTFQFTGAVGSTSKTATIISPGVFRWVVDGPTFFSVPGSGSVRARLNQVAGPITSSWAGFTVVD